MDGNQNQPVETPNEPTATTPTPATPATPTPEPAQ